MGSGLLQWSRRDGQTVRLRLQRVNLEYCRLVTYGRFRPRAELYTVEYFKIRQYSVNPTPERPSWCPMDNNSNTTRYLFTVGRLGPHDRSKSVPQKNQCQCKSCDCDEDATTIDDGGTDVCDACADYATDDDGATYCSRCDEYVDDGEYTGGGMHGCGTGWVSRPRVERR